MIERHSSRRRRLDAGFLAERLAGARSYDRIAGYFSSSILEVAGEALESVRGRIRVVCNSALSRADVEAARAAQAALRREWCDSRPEELGDAARPRFRRLHGLLRSGKLAVRVLPDEVFGLIHGKAGVVTRAGGRRTCFLGSANETARAFRLNYELLWEDDAPDAVAWVQEEFDALWSSPFAVPLAEFVVRDLDRLARREVIGGVADWREAPDPAPVVVEAPVYRRDAGLWEHQKHFVKLAFDAHRGPHGARFVLADEVGLGKTLQLAMAAQLMALSGERPVLVLAPRTLVRQWQDELDARLGMPSAVWTGRQWVDERGVEHPGAGPASVRRCPRRVGIVSTGLITSGSEAAELLAGLRFECVILDEAHRARRRNLDAERPYAPARPNNLLRFLQEVAPRTKSLLLATATPAQLHPVEAHDLLDALARGSDAVLGGPGSRWRDARPALDLVLGRTPPPSAFDERWDWLRNPFPPRSEGRDFEILRRTLALPDAAAHAPGRAADRLRAPDRQRIEDGFPRFVERHNPWVRTIVLRTRGQLERTIDPETGAPCLAPVRVRLHGESDADALRLPPFLQDAYGLAERFCALLAERANAGFFRTLLLRRMGSTMYAGRRTVERLLRGGGPRGAAGGGRRWSRADGRAGPRGGALIDDLGGQAAEDGAMAGAGDAPAPEEGRALAGDASAPDEGGPLAGDEVPAEHEDEVLAEEEDEAAEDEAAEDEAAEGEDRSAAWRALTGPERDVLLRLRRALSAERGLDPKYAAVRRLLVEEDWLRRGCIVFSQYFDSVRWLAGRLSIDLPDEPVGLYAGANRSGVLRGGAFTACRRDALQDAVRRGETRLLLGTDAASEGLNLQRLGALVNLDLPWNPSRLEQRKGRIQRIGQVRSEVDVCNLRYAGSVEDRVRRLLSERLENVARLFGQLPDTLEDAWVQVALGRVEDAKRTIDAVPDRHPFVLRHREVRPVDWESCARVLDADAKRRALARGWDGR